MRKYIYLVVVLLIVACSSNKSNLSDNNFFNKNYYYNDSLKVGIDFDQKYFFKEVINVKKKEYKQLSQRVNNITAKDLFLVAGSGEDAVNIYLLQQNIKSADNNLTNSRIIATDTVSNTLIFEKQNGKFKILGLVKTKSKMDNKFLLEMNDFIGKITFGTANQRKLSFPSIFINYFPSTHPNPLFARMKLSTVPLHSEGENSAKFQFLSTVNSFMTNNKMYDSLINSYEIKRKEKFNSLIIELYKEDEVCKDSAVYHKLSQLAKENQLLILNEDHYYPKHRLFAMELLENLKANGYKYLSLEGFNASSEGEFTPNYHNGIYTSEPYFSHFIRKALSLGFKVSGHENLDKSIEREIGQAKNILSILEKEPMAKIFIYVGHSHLEKSSENKKWMAQHLKELSGINPITINQAEIIADTDRKLILIPNRFLNDLKKTKSTADFFLINNLKPSLKEIYPDLIFKEASINSKEFLAYKNEEILVEVINLTEFISLKNLAVPITNFLTIPKGKGINLNLPIGNYHIFVKTAEDKTIYSRELIIK